MASCDYTVFQKGTNLQTAFKESVDEALYLSGHGGYTGTIAEKGEVVLRKKQPLTRTEAEAFARNDIETNDKWGPSFAVAVCESEEDRKVTGFLFYGYAPS